MGIMATVTQPMPLLRCFNENIDLVGTSIVSPHFMENFYSDKFDRFKRTFLLTMLIYRIGDARIWLHSPSSCQSMQATTCDKATKDPCDWISPRADGLLLAIKTPADEKQSPLASEPLSMQRD